MRSFIETQFPVSLLSKESYKERKAGSGQTLTGLGKWWGRKPLVLVRATILGLLLPSTPDTEKDREVFLRLMTMDPDGLWHRKNKALSASFLYEHATEAERKTLFTGKKLASAVSKEMKAALERRVFDSLPYEQKLEYCCRPEQIRGPSPESWQIINAHCGTSSASIQEFVEEMGQRTFGHTPRVGDAFCGGGSIPFEAARIGCEAFGNDLNPVAALLTWGALNLVGGGPEVAEKVSREQERILAAVDKQITEWGIEHDEKGRRADAYLYLTETKCPSCGWLTPLAPSFVIGEKSKTVAQLKPLPKEKRYGIEVLSDVTDEEMKKAKIGTVGKGRMLCPNPNCGTTHAIADIRGDKTVKTEVDEDGKHSRERTYGLRLWDNADVVPRPDDVFQERLYCVRWVSFDAEGKAGKRTYEAVTPGDIKREAQVLKLLQERFAEWQERGFIPSARIQPGDKTDEPIRTRGWTHWHHLFNPRQLLSHGLVAKHALANDDRAVSLALTLILAKLANWDSRMCFWITQRPGEGGAATFTNQALNAMWSYAARGYLQQISTISDPLAPVALSLKKPCKVSLGDAREIAESRDIWLTDPPYADAVNYHELTEIFLAWIGAAIFRHFNGWYSDSKRALAAQGSTKVFRKTMVEIYQNLTNCMAEGGSQVVMFTHQDAEVWADLGLILWAAGLQVTSAWTIATETSSGGLKDGNYVQGTVFLVLRKNTSTAKGYASDILEEIEQSVPLRLQEMRAIDQRDEPDFSDADYNLATYAAALQAVTGYKEISGIDANKVLFGDRPKGWEHPFKKFIDAGLSTGVKYLVPVALGTTDAERKLIWKLLTAEERFYLKGLDAEAKGLLTQSTYQEFARVYGVVEYSEMVASTKANAYRLKNPVEFARASGGAAFAETVTRQVLHAIRLAKAADDIEEGVKHLRTSLSAAGYWENKPQMIAILRFMRQLPQESWKPVRETVDTLYQRLAAESNGEEQ